MAKTVFAMITLLEDGAFGGRPDQSLPGHEGSGDPGYDRPIHHPGHPDHGLPSRPVHPGNRPPGSAGGRPDNSLPWSPGSPDQGLPVPPGISPPPVPPNLAQQVVVLWHMPGQTQWHGKVIDPATINRPDQGLPAQPPPTAGTPLPETPAPKG
jgi:hypothetical protein